MNRKQIALGIFGYFFFGILLLFPQNNSEVKQSLSAILSKIETTYQVTFTYGDAYITGLTIEPPDASLSLEAVVDYLSAQTGLSFQTLSDNSIIISKDVLLDITSTQYLDEVVVNNFLTNGISLKPGGITSIRPKQFGILPGQLEPDILQSIQALPGILSVDERVSNLNIRGGTNDQNLILWDGIKMYQSGHFFGLISAFNPYLIENVKVAKNGSSSMYGDGVSGIIDMQNSSNLQGDLSAGIGANLISADGYIKVPTGDRSELQASGRRSITDLFSTPTYNSYFDRIFQDTDVTNASNNTVSLNQNFYFYDASLKWIYDITERDKLIINALAIYNNLDYDEQSTNNNLDQIVSSNLIQFNLVGGLEYRRQWNEKLRTSIQFYGSHYNLDATNFNINNEQRLIQENQVLDTGLKAHANYEIEQNLNYFGGYQFSEIGISNLEDVNNPEFRRYIKEVIRTHAIFNEVKFTSNSRNTSIRLGLRNSYIEKFEEFYTEPRLSFSQRFFKNFRFEILAELKSQTSSQIIDLQNDFLGVEKRRWTLANNESIPVIQSRQASIGLHYNKNRLLLSAEAYIKEVEGINSRSQGFQNQYQFVNEIGSYRVKGIDLLVNKRFTNFSTWLSYSYSKNNYTFDNLNNGISFPNNSDIRHVITFAGTYTYNKIKIALGANWRTGKPYTLPDVMETSNSGSIIYQSPNSSNLEDYFRVDLSANYNFTIGRAKAIAGLSIWNLLNTNNTINTYFVDNDDSSVSQIDNQSLGFTPNVSFRVNF